MSLIKGMDDVMTHIKNQEIRIKKLEEENKRLKEEHNKFDEIWKTEGITEQDIIDMKRQISNQCDLIKSLKENKYDKFQCAKCLGHHTGCSNPTCDSCVKELKELNESQRKTIQDYHTKEAKRLNEIYCINKQMESLKMKLVDLEEFKKKAEDECEASVVMEAMMTRVEQAESNQKKSEEKTEEYKSTFGLLNEMIKDKDNMIYKFLVHPSNEKRFNNGDGLFRRTCFWKLSS